MKTKISMILCLALTACASVKPPEKREIQSTGYTSMGYDSVWSGLIDGITADGMAIRNTDKSSGLITFDHIPDENFYNEFFDCGKKNILAGINYKPIALSITVRSEKKTKVAINLHGSYSTGIGGNAPGIQIVCYSTGKFERKVLDLVKAN